MNIKKLFLVFTTALLAQFSFALSVPTPVVLASPQVQQSNRVVDFHNMLDAGTYGIYSDQTLVNGPPATGIKTAIVVYAYKDNYDKVVNQTVFDSDGSGWQEYYDYSTKKWSAWSQFGGGGGQKGDKGDKGDIGPPGLPGVKGDAGAQGIQGIQGLTGAKGDIGLTGAQGIQGIQGVAGKDGANGKDGKDGLINPMTAVGDMVVGGTSGAPAKLSKGATGAFLAATSSGEGWENPLVVGLKPVRSLVAGKNVTLTFNGTAATIDAVTSATDFTSEFVQQPSAFVTSDANSPRLLSTQVWTKGVISEDNIVIPAAVGTVAGGFNVNNLFYIKIPNGSKVTLTWTLELYNIAAITTTSYKAYLTARVLYDDGSIVNMSSLSQDTVLDKAAYKSQRAIYTITNYQMQTKNAVGVILSSNSNDLQDKTAVIGGYVSISVKPFN